jgi:hypothetical protein
MDIKIVNVDKIIEGNVRKAKPLNPNNKFFL